MDAYKMKHGGAINWLKGAVWVLILYLFVFQPIFNKYVYIGIEVLLVIGLLISNNHVFADNFNLFKKEYFFAGLICAYSFFMDMLHFEIVYLDRFIASFFQGYVVSLLIIFFLSKSLFLQERLSNCLVMMCFIACSITIAAILIPSFGQFCINHATLDAKERLQELFLDGGRVQYRSYGLSESLNFTYAYVLSIIGGYLLSSNFKIYTPLILIMIFVAIIFNARIAFFPLLISLFYILFLKKKSMKGVLSFSLTALVLVLLAIWGMNAFPVLNNEWGLSFFKELSAFFSGQDNGTIGTLTGSMWIIPDDALGLFFGTGENLFVSSNNNSDVGYILQLNYGGLFLLGIILLYFIHISKRVARRLTFRHWFTIMFISSVFILNFKGFYLAAIPGNRFLTFLYVYYIYATRKGIDELTPRCSLIPV